MSYVAIKTYKPVVGNVVVVAVDIHDAVSKLPKHPRHFEFASPQSVPHLTAHKEFESVVVGESVRVYMIHKCLYYRVSAAEAHGTVSKLAKHDKLGSPQSAPTTQHGRQFVFASPQSTPHLTVHISQQS